jgi:Tfp pilus assembly protein PilW
VSRLRDLRERDESGFTLIELLVGTVMLTIIIGALVAAVIMTLGTQKTQDRLVDSHDEQLAAAHFAGDVASAEGFSDRTSPSPCAATGVLLALQWVDPGSGGKVYVDYALNGKELTRSTCLGTGAANTIAIAHDVATAGCVNASGTSVACSTVSTLSAFGIRFSDAGGKSITLTATRRV